MASTDKTQTFDEFIVHEILEAKGNWLELVAASILPPDLYDKLRKGQKFKDGEEYFKKRNVWLLDQQGESRIMIGPQRGRAQVFATFKPIVSEGKLDFQAYVAGLRVNVITPENAEKN